MQLRGIGNHSGGRPAEIRINADIFGERSLRQLGDFFDQMARLHRAFLHIPTPGKSEQLLNGGAAPAGTLQHGGEDLPPLGIGHGRFQHFDPDHDRA